MMEICQARPPNFAAIVKAFPSARGGNVVFAYGDVLYVPSGGVVSPELMEHEETHGRRQLGFPGGVDHWWNRYLVEKEFMFDEELAAHRAEYAHFRAHHGTAHSRGFLKFISKRLSGPLYGNACTRERAARLIVQTDVEEAA